MQIDFYLTSNMQMDLYLTSNIQMDLYINIQYANGLVY